MDNVSQSRCPKVKAAAAQCGIGVADIEDVLPATAAQEALFALSVNQPSTYVARYVYKLSADTDLTQFCNAWKQTAHDHSSLRTRFIQSDSGEVLQAVLRRSPSCTRHPCDNLASYLDQDLRRPIAWGDDIARAALVESTEGGGTHFVFTLHHVAYDDWALAVFLQHLESAYLSQHAKFTPYVGFVQYCNGVVNSRIAAAFWTKELSQNDAAIWPPRATGYSPTATNSLVHRTRMPVPMDLEDASTTTLLAWAALLKTYTGSSEIGFGVTSHGRRARLPGMSTVGGLTIATFPLLMKLEGDGDILESWQNLGHRLGEMVVHEQYGLHNIASLSSAAATACGFQSLVVLQTRRKDDYTLLSEKTLDMGLNNHATFGTYALTLVVEMEDDGVSVEAVYDDHIIPEAQVKHMQWQLSHLIGMINSTVMDSDKASIPITALWAPCEQGIQQLQAWNSLEHSQSSRPVCAHTMISQKAKEQPFAEAICAWDGSFTYHELDKLSGNLAGYLQSHYLQVQPDSVIPLYFEKSKWTAVAMLGVLKVGAAFTLMDPATPLDRLRTIFREVNAPLMLCNDSNLSGAAEVSPSAFSINKGINRDNSARDLLSLSPDSILYVMFTSGSTGTPKGVIIEHGAFCHSVQAYIHKAGLCAQSRTLQYASYAFDVAVTDHLATLIAGGCICIPAPQACADDIAGEITRYTVNYADLTPSVLRTLRPSDLPTLKTIIVGGESMSLDDVLTWAQSVRIINIYGPAECCVLSTMQTEIKPDSDPRNIGFATGGSCWVVDQDDHSVLLPIGGVGELLIGGPIVGRGYLNMPEKTQSAFIQAPEWHRKLYEEPLARLYKSGDLVQQEWDGSFCILGRKDFQVKIRGQRIELGEVEHCIRQEMNARGIVVDTVVFERNPSATLLVAFFHLDDASQHATGIFSPPSLSLQAEFMAAKDRLRVRVPNYMVPDLILPVVRIPLTATGKTDRKLLKASAAHLTEDEYLAHTTTPQGSNRAEPSSAHEQILQDIFSRQIGIKPESLGVHDNLIAIGLDSITVMKTVGLLRQQGLLLKGSDVHAFPTIAQLAPLLQAKDRTLATAQPSSVNLPETREQKMDKIFMRLSSDLFPNGRTAEEPQGTNVLLTGASGSLGPYVLSRLIQDPSIACVYCAVRREGATDIQKQLHMQNGLAADFAKVQFVKTSLAEPHFGLTPPVYRMLLDKITHVIHLAWTVNFVLPLEEFVDSQIAAVRQLVNFCSLSRTNAQLSFASSIGITFGAAHQQTCGSTVPERLLPNWNCSPSSGYAEAKHICESLVSAACAQTGLQGAILRLGQIAGPVGSDASGPWNIKEWLPAIVAASRIMKRLPRDLGPLNNVDWVPVNLMAAATVEIAMGRTDRSIDGACRVYHLVNPRRTTWTALAPAVASTMDDCQLTDFKRWVRALDDRLQVDKETLEGASKLSATPAAQLMDYYREMQAHSDHYGAYKQIDNIVATAHSTTLRELEPVSVKWMQQWMQQWAF